MGVQGLSTAPDFPCQQTCGAHIRRRQGWLVKSWNLAPHIRIRMPRQNLCWFGRPRGMLATLHQPLGPAGTRTTKLVFSNVFVALKTPQFRTATPRLKAGSKMKKTTRATEAFSSELQPVPPSRRAGLIVGTPHFRKAFTEPDPDRLARARGRPGNLCSTRRWEAQSSKPLYLVGVQ